MRWMSLIVFLAVFGPLDLVRGDYLIVRHDAFLKASPDSVGVTLVALKPGISLALLSPSQHAGYYKVRVLPSGPSGWVYRTFVRRYPGTDELTHPTAISEPVSSIRLEHDEGLRGTVASSHDEVVFDAYESYDPNGRWYTYAGVPLPKGYPQPLNILRNTGYVVGYDEIRHDPAWTCYRCFRFNRLGTPARPTWKTDKRSTAGISTSDYANTDYSRGHMAPNYAIFQCYGRTAQLETFLMTNVCPQFQANNDGIWGDLEELIANTWAQERGDVWVICGPIFNTGSAPKSIGRSVQVPDAFFMIVIDEQAGRPEALAFRIPHTNDRGHRPEEYLTSIREIEAATQLDFLSPLPDSIEDTLELARPTQLWSRLEN